MTAVYVAIALIAAIPAVLAFVLYIFVWALHLFRPRSKNQPSSGQSKPARSAAVIDERTARNYRPEHALPSPVRSLSSFVLEDAFLPVAGKVRPRDQRAAQSAAEKLILGNPDATNLFAARSLKRRKPRWNVLLREVAVLSVKPHQQTWLEQHISDTMKNSRGD